MKETLPRPGAAEAAEARDTKFLISAKQGLLRHQIAPAVGSHSHGLPDLNFPSQSGKMIAWLAATCRRHPVITLTSI